LCKDDASFSYGLVGIIRTLLGQLQKQMTVAEALQPHNEAQRQTEFLNVERHV